MQNEALGFYFCKTNILLGILSVIEKVKIILSQMKKIDKACKLTKAL